MSKIGPGNHERAWNDPPVIAFTSSNSSSSGRLKMLNKRLAVPIPGSPATVGNSPLPSPMRPGEQLVAPPMTCSPMVHNLTPLNSPMPVITVEEENELKSSKERMDDTMASFQQVIEGLENVLKGSIVDEINRRLFILRKMWNDGSLNVTVVKRMNRLADAMNRGEFETAWTIHQGLIVDYTNICSPWMFGVKSLILEARSAKTDKTGSVAITPESSNENKLEADCL